MGLAIAFDSKNRPYFLADRTGTLTGKIRTLRNGLWHDIDYSTADWTGYSELFYTEITIDSSDALYASMWISRHEWRLLYSPDITASSPVFHIYEIPVPANIEKNMSHGDNSNPPVIITWPWVSLANRHKLRLYIPSKNSNGTLSLTDTLTLAKTHAESHSSHSGGTPSVVSKNGKIHVTYLSEKDSSGNDSNSSRIWVATIDRATKNIDYHAHLAQTHGYPGPVTGADNHSMPVIGITSTDTVVVILGTHGETFPYYKATSTNTTSTLTNQNDNVPNVNRATTYVDLVIDDGDTLHTSYRTYTGALGSAGLYRGVGYSRRPRSATAWDNEKVLLAPDAEVKNVHSVPHQRLFMDRQSGRRNLYLVGLDEGSNQDINPYQLFSAYPTPLISTTDGGSSWSLMTRYDLLGRINDGKTVQRITFPAIPNKYPNEMFYLNATTDASGLTVSYEVVSGPATLVGNKVTVGSGTGEVVIKAKNSGDATYYADEVTQRFQVDTATVSNLAQGKPAYQSVTWRRQTASLAVDGNTGGTLSEGSATRDEGSENWWEVDLGSVSYIDNIQIYNRSEAAAAAWLSNYHVFISNVPFTGTTVAASQAQSGVADYHQTTQAGRPTTISNINRTGRYIRVQLTSSNTHLTMGEVRVNGSYSVADTAPDAFTFTAQNGVMPSTTITSNTVTISGLNGAAPISVTGGTLVVDGNDFTGATITNAQTVAVKVTSSSAFRATTSATVTIGGVSANFSVTTDFSMATDRMPTFGQQTISNQAWTQNQAITAFTLPTASGGNGTLTYTLSPSLPRGVTRNTTTQRVSGTPSANQATTTYTWKVTDIDNDPATLTFTIAVNGVPTANAGDDQTVDEGDAVSLSGSGTDPESSALTYSWTQTGGTPTVTLTGATTRTPSFTAPNLIADATLTFTLTVSDGSLTDTDTVDITIRADNDAPTANAGMNQTVADGTSVSLSGSGTDPEGQSLTYSWSQTAGTPNVTLTGATTKTPSFTAPEVTTDATLTFTLTVNDGTLNGTDTVDITIQAENDAPTANAGMNQTVDEGDTVSLSGSGSDPENGALTYSWSQTGGTPNVTLTGATTQTPSFTAPELLANATLTFTLTVNDGTSNGTDTVDITITADNDAPTAEAGTNQTVDEGDTVSLSGSGTDPESQNLTYSWAQTGGSPNVTLTGTTTQTPSFTAPELLANATLTFTLTVNDGTSNGTDTVDITITADNDAPSANAGTDQTVDEGDTVSLSGSGSDPESQNLTYSWAQTAGSPNVTLSGATTQTPSFTAPELLANATLTFTLTVNDGTSNGTDTVDIIIRADNDAPSANAGTDQTVDEGDTVSLSGSGTDPESQNLTYSWSQTGGSPNVTLTGATTQTPSFTAPELLANATLTFTLTVNDGTSNGTDTVDIIIRADNDAPTAEAGTDQTVDEGDTVSLSGSGSDPESQNLTYSWAQTAGSPNVTLTGATTQTPSFTAPELLANATLTFTLTVNDGTSNGTDTVDIIIRADNDAPSASAGDDQTVAEGAAVSLSGSGTDPESQNLTYSWAQTAGSPNVTLTGATTKTPSFTAPNVVANVTLTFTLTVNDGTSNGTDTVDITIVADNDAPTANAGMNQTVDEGDAVSLSGSGIDPESGALTYSWTQTGGSPTVTLTGATTQTPSFTAPNVVANVTLTFTLTVNDGVLNGTDTVEITVRGDNDAPTAEAGMNQTVAEGAAVSLSGSGTDPEGQSLTYSWAQTAGSPNVTLTGATTKTPSFTAPELLANATLTFTLTVGDGNSTDTDTVEITITADNDAPSANAGTDKTVNEGDTVSLSGSGIDPESQSLTYSWAQTGGSPNVTLTGATTQTPSFTAPNVVANVTLTFTLTVNDGTSNGTDTVEITITADNDAPTANAGMNQTVDEGAEVSLSGSGIDPESGALTYSWTQTGGSPNVTLTGATTQTPSFTAPNVTANVTLTFTLTVNDGNSNGTDTVDITIRADNDAPTANAGMNQTVDEGDAVSLSGSGSDPESGALTYLWTQTGGSPNVTLTGATTQTPSFTAPELTANVTLTFTLTVSDGTSNGTDTVDITITADNDAPTANAGTDRTVAEGAEVSLSGSGIDPESGALTYLWTQTGGSPNVTLTGATTQTPSFTAPDLTTDATLTFTLTVSDGNSNGTDTVEITITADPNRAPVASSAIAAQTLTVGGPNITVNAANHFSDPDGDALTYTARLSETDIATVGVAGAIVTIRPVAVGDVTITVTANDGTLKAEQTIEVAVIQAAHTPETTPDAFSFTPRTQVSPSATVTSNAITVSGLEAPASISVRGGTLVVDGSTFTGATVSNGQTVAVQVRASSRYAATATARVTIGGVSADFAVTTRTPNTTPGSFSFTAQTGVDPGATVTSNAITVRGLEAPTSIAVSGGSLIVNGRAFSGSTVTNRQTVAVQVTASVGFNTTTIARVTIGGVSADFSVTTADVMLDEITFSAEAISAEELSVGINEAFDPTTLTYTADVAHAESRLTGTAAAATGHVAIITPDDADPELAGHQVDLAVGTTPIIFRVTASDGTTARYYTVLVRRPPGQVTGVEITPRAGQLVVSWEQVPGADGYKVQWKTDDQAFDDVRQMTIISGTTTTATIPNLTAGTTYSVQVIATETDAGDGTASTPSTDMPRAAPPGQVTGVQVMAGIGQLHVSWTAVPGADGYKVQWKTGAQAYDPATRQATVPDSTMEVEAAYDRTTRQAAVPIPTSYVIPGLAADTQYTVRVIATRTLADDGMPSAEATGTPSASLLNNPNPFNASTMIHYALAHGQPVRLTIYNVLGQVVARLVDGYQAAGVYHVRWEAPSTLASGVYLVRLRLREDVQIRRILLIK